MIVGMAGFEQFAEGSALAKNLIGMFSTNGIAKVPIFGTYGITPGESQIVSQGGKKYYAVTRASSPSVLHYVDITPTTLGLGGSEAGTVYFSARTHLVANSIGSAAKYITEAPGVTGTTTRTYGGNAVPVIGQEQFWEVKIEATVSQIIVTTYLNGSLVQNPVAIARNTSGAFFFGIVSGNTQQFNFTVGDKTAYFGMTDVTIVLDRESDTNKTGRLGAIRVLPLKVSTMAGGTKWSTTPSGADPVAVVNKPVGNQTANMATVLNTDPAGESATFSFDNTMTGDIKGVCIGINASKGQLAQTSMEHTISDGTTTTTPVTTLLPSDQGASMIGAGALLEKTPSGNAWTPEEIGKLSVKIRSVPAK